MGWFVTFARGIHSLREYLLLFRGYLPLFRGYSLSLRGVHFSSAGIHFSSQVFTSPPQILWILPSSIRVFSPTQNEKKSVPLDGNTLFYIIALLFLRRPFL